MASAESENENIGKDSFGFNIVPNHVQPAYFSIGIISKTAREGGQNSALKHRITQICYIKILHLRR